MVNPQMYKSFGYPWFDWYDDGMPDVNKSDTVLCIIDITSLSCIVLFMQS